MFTKRIIYVVENPSSSIKPIACIKNQKAYCRNVQVHTVLSPLINFFCLNFSLYTLFARMEIISSDSDDASEICSQQRVDCDALFRYGNYHKSLQCSENTEVTLGDLNNPWLFFRLFTRPQKIIIEWLQDQKVIATQLVCNKCNLECVLTSRSKRLDKYTFRCPSKEHEYTIRKNSFFIHFRFHFQDVMVFLMGFLEELSLYRISEKSGINYSNAAPKWAMIIRKVMIQFVWNRYFTNNSFKLSGIIQADESKFGHVRKNHRGEKKCSNDIWVFGLTCSRTDRTLLFPVEKRCVFHVHMFLLQLGGG